MLLVAGTLAASGTDTADTTLVEDDTTFDVNWHDCGADSRHALETTTAPTNGCGPVGGVPLGEILALTGDSYTQTYNTSSTDGLPLTLDVARDISGEIHVHSWTGVTGAGVGRIVVNGTLRASVLKDGATRPTTVTLGTFTGEGLATPQADSVAIAFTLDLDDAPATGSPVRGWPPRWPGSWFASAGQERRAIAR